MRYANDPRQNRLFDVFQDILSPLAYKELQAGWQNLFRQTVLELMPVDTVKMHFDPVIGQPTKELYSTCGLIFLMEFMNWTAEEAASAYMFRVDIQYALNLDPERQSMSSRTVERYKKLIVEDGLAGRIMEDITAALIEKLDLSVAQQRLDSTHIQSDMAQFGRTRMMGVTIKRFLTQLKRHDRPAYDGMSEEFRRRYQPSGYLLFGDVKKDAENRQLLREQVAQDMHDLIKRFGDDKTHNTRSTFAMLVRVFNEQCEVIEDAIEIRKHPGGDVIQNTSDPDATRDGKKGPGYQVQLAETCDEKNAVQLITAAIPQTAAEHDSNAIEPVLEALEKSDAMPESMLADTAYGSDANVQTCQDRDVELVSPSPGKGPNDAYAMNSDDFVVNETTGEVESCPSGEQPLESSRDETSGKTIVVMAGSTCAGCSHRKDCPVRRRKDGDYEFCFTDKQRRLASRRREEETGVFRERYRKRSGIEATNSIVKRVTGLGRLRVRGRPGVFHSILLKVAGWNLFQAARALRMRRRRQTAVALA
jgi:hypothetical protein